MILPGFFNDTLPNARLGPLSVVRLDGDMYESTLDALTTLYDRRVQCTAARTGPPWALPPMLASLRSRRRGRLSLWRRGLSPLASRLPVSLSPPHGHPRRLSPGGWVIIDDWALAPCRRAVLHFRRHRGIAEGEAGGCEMLRFYSGDRHGVFVNVFWQKRRR